MITFNSNRTESNPPARFPGLWQRIQKKEFLYRQALVPVPQEPNELNHYGKVLEERFSSLVFSLNRLRDAADTKFGPFQKVLDEYEREIREIHAQNQFWSKVYLSFQWPAQQKRPKGLPSFAVVLGQALVSKDEHRVFLDELMPLVRQWQTLPTDSYRSRRWQMRIARELFQKTSAQIHENSERLKKCFDSTVFTHYLEMPSASSAGPMLDVFSVRPSKTQGRTFIRKRLADWLRGYAPLSKIEEQPLVNLVQTKAAEDFGKIARILRGRRIILGVTLTVGLLFCVWLGVRTDVPDRMRFAIKAQLDAIWKFVWAPQAADPKTNYFQEQIVRIDQDYRREDFLAKAREFVEKKLYATPHAHWVFSDLILKGYLLLLAKGDADAEFQEATLAAARALDPMIEHSLEALNHLYTQPNILESELRTTLFRLRRQMNQHDVFLFFFLVLNEDTPFIFVYPEEINLRLILTKADLLPLGLNAALYPNEDLLQAEVDFVPGKYYPFKNAAGFFEGEYAVVLESVAGHPDWTALHEVGHVVENRRIAYEKILPAQNIELYAVLFPLIFAPDNKVYALEHLVPLAQNGRAEDCYAQAAKGILNGFLLYDGQRRSGQATLISNRFEPERLEKARGILSALSPQEISQISLLFYWHSDWYLRTAQKGRYLPLKTNAEELIYGSHSSVQQEIVRTEFSLFGPLGPHHAKLLRDRQAGPISQPAHLAALWAAILVFILVEAWALLLHAVSRIVRERKFFGRSMKELAHRMFHPSQEKNEKVAGPKTKNLLVRILKAGGNISDDLRQEVADFFMQASSSERIRFNLGLALAPFLPQRSRIFNQGHLLLFYLPFVGPYLARSKWIWSKQKDFDDREVYNRRLSLFVADWQEKRGLAPLREEFAQIVSSYEEKRISPTQIVALIHKLNTNELESYVNEYLKDENRMRPSLQLGTAVSAFGNLGLGMNRRAGGTDFDRLERYTPQEDVRDIDWKRTARSVEGEPMVRKRLLEEEGRVSLLLDLSALQQPELHRWWAQELAKSIKVLSHQQSLESLIFFLPGGQVEKQLIQWNSRGGHAFLAQKILHKVVEKYQEGWSPYDQLPAGLKFYTPEENERYRRQVSLADWHLSARVPTVGPLNLKDRYILLVGVRPQKRRYVAKLLGKRNKGFYWVGTRAVKLS